MTTQAVLYQAPQAEIRGLIVTPDGVYFGTSAPTKRRSGKSTDLLKLFGTGTEEKRRA